MKMTLKNIILTAITGFCALSSLSAQVTQTQAKALLEKADKNTSFAGTDYKANYTVSNITVSENVSIAFADII